MADAPKGTDPPQLKRVRGKKTADVVIRHRVSVVFGLLVAGSTRAQVLQAVSQAFKQETDAHAKLDAQGVAATSGRPRKDDQRPLRVWGLEEPHVRTVDRYIMLAKKLIERDGKALRDAKLEHVLGLQWSRINALYAKAYSGGHLNVCARLIEEVNGMFGLRGLVLLGQAGDGAGVPQSAITSGDDSSVVHDAVPETPLTSQQAVAELQKILAAGVMRRMAAITGKAPLSSLVKTGNGAASSDTTKQNPAGGNGSNGSH